MNNKKPSALGSLAAGLLGGASYQNNNSAALQQQVAAASGTHIIIGAGGGGGYSRKAHLENQISQYGKTKTLTDCFTDDEIAAEFARRCTPLGKMLNEK